MAITRWSIPKSDWLYSLQPNKKSSIESAKGRLAADCGSDHELLIAKFRLKMKKVGKTTRSFRYDLNKIPYNYTVEVTNRFKGLDLIEGVPEELWIEVCDLVQEAGIKTITKKKAKWLSEEALKIAVKRREGSTHGHHQMVNTEIRLIILFAAKDGEALYSLQTELTVAQIMNSLLPNSDWNWKK